MNCFGGWSARMRIEVGDRVIIETRTILQYLALYVLMIIHGAKIFVENSTLISNGTILLCAAYIIYHKRLVNNKYVLHMLGLMAIMIMMIFVHGEPYFFSVGLRIIEQFLILFVAYSICPKNFIDRYVKIVLIFAVISLIFYFIQITQPDLLRRFLTPVSGWGDGENWGSEFYGIWLYTYRGRLAQYRNNGIFTEPGLYQMLLNSAIMLLLFFPSLIKWNPKQNARAVVMLVITVLTTGSTTGYISLAVILLGYLLKGSRRNEKVRGRKYITLFLVLIVGTIIVEYYIRNENSLLYNFVFSKFLDMGINENASGNGRLQVLSICIELLKNNKIGFIVGVGYGAVTGAISNASSATGGAFIVSYLAAVGIPVLIYTIYPYILSTFGSNGYKMESVVCLFLYFNTTFAQSREVYASLMLLPFAIYELSKLRSVSETNRINEREYE